MLHAVFDFGSYVPYNAMRYVNAFLIKPRYCVGQFKCLSFVCTFESPAFDGIFHIRVNLDSDLRYVFLKLRRKILKFISDCA